MNKILPRAKFTGTRSYAYRSLRQAGQAIIYIVAMLPAIFLSILVIYNTAMTTREKMSLQNTADAMTYSAGVVVARNLNFLAYTNRAMAANEAGIATVGSMQTTATMLLTVGANLFEAQALIYSGIALRHFVQIPEPIVGQLVHLPAYIANVIKAQNAHRRAKSIGRAIGPMNKPFELASDFLRVLNYGISASQAAMYLSTIASIPTTVKDVMEKNDPDASLPVADTLINAVAFAAQYGLYIRPYWQGAGSNSAFGGLMNAFDSVQSKMGLGVGSEQQRFNEALRFAHTAQAMRDDWTKNRRFLPGFLTGSNFIGKIVNFLKGSLLDWKGGSELVSERANSTSASARLGRIRWQSADSLYINAPIDTLLGNVVPIMTRSTDYKDKFKLPNPAEGQFVVGRFGIGAGAAAQSTDNFMRSWSGKRITLPAEGDVARTYGDLNSKGGEMERSAFDRAAASDDRDLFLENPATWMSFLLDAKWQYGKRQNIGMFTKNTHMPPFWDVRTHPQMKENESDSWQGQQAINGKNPLQWGSKTNRGPVFTLSVEKNKSKLGTGEQKGFGFANGQIGLKDNMITDKVKVLSSTQVYFRRPQDRWQRRELGKDDPPTINGVNVGLTGGYIEHRNLFSPYWHVHHVQPSTWARAVAIGTPLIGNAAQPDGKGN